MQSPLLIAHIIDECSDEFVPSYDSTNGRNEIQFSHKTST